MNEINVHGQVGLDVTAAQVRAQLSKLDNSQPLTVHIDSEGGSVFEGQSIAELIRSYPSATTAIVEPTAFSIASYIAMAADRIEIAENGFMMIHQAAGNVDGTSADLRQSAELLGKLDASMAAEYAKRSGQPLSTVVSWMTSETFFSATEALSYGFVDSVRSRPTRTKANLSRGILPAHISASLRRGPTPAARVTPVNAAAKWTQAVETALPQCRNNRRAAVKMVARANPQLRALMVAAANTSQVRTKSTAKPRAYFEVQRDVDAIVAKLVARGMSHPRAVSKAFRDNPRLREQLVSSANTKR